MSPLTAAFLAVFLLASALLCVYGAHAWLMTWLYHRKRGSEPAWPPVDRYPVVTVQLPVYNEVYVVRRLVNAVASFDYPKDRLEIQVLDDSTDETGEAIERLVDEKRSEGFRIEHVRRSHRTGFKGGALREGLILAKGD